MLIKHLCPVVLDLSKRLLTLTWISSCYGAIADQVFQLTAVDFSPERRRSSAEEAHFAPMLTSVFLSRCINL